MSDLHRQPVTPLRRPLAPPVGEVDEASIRARHTAAATATTSFWRRAERRSALDQAAIRADAEIASARSESVDRRTKLQAALDARWNELLSNDPDVVLTTMTEAFEEHEAHAAPVSVDGDELSVAVIVPGTEIVPERWPTTTAAGNLSLAKISASNAAGTYIVAVCGQVLAVVRLALSVAPAISSVRVAAVRVSGPDAYGHRHPQCLVAATFPRAALEGVDWAHADSPVIFDQVSTDVEIRLAGRVKHLEPIDLAAEPELARLVDAIDVEPSGE